jgi:hypothetical protein
MVEIPRNITISDINTSFAYNRSELLAPYGTFLADLPIELFLCNNNAAVSPFNAFAQWGK